MTIGAAHVSAVTPLVVDDDGMASAADCDAATPAYFTLSAAVAAASPGDTIKVCPGVYNELVQVDKTLTLLGAQAGVDARTRAVPVTSESVVGSGDGAFQILADKVVIDGFTIQGVTNDPTAPPFTGLGAGIWTNPGFSGTQGGHQIRNNIVQNNIVGIYLNSACTFPTEVRFNLIKDNNNAGPASGNGIYSDVGLCNALIDNNKFSGHENSSVELVGTQSSITISNNELVGGGTFASERIVLANTTASSITGNFANGLTRPTGTIRLFGGNDTIAIDGNTLLNGVIGIRVDDPFAIGPNSNVTGAGNCIAGNSVAGLQVDTGGHTGTLNAENNWWGSSTGPTNAGNPGGTGDKVIAPDNNVDFIPFLTSPPDPPCPPPPPPTLDHFECYDVGNVHDVKQGVSLKDQFGSSGVLVHQAVEFCNPVQKTHNNVVTPITNANGHLAIYKFDHDAFEGSNEEPTRTVQVQNQFGKQTLTVTEVQFLAVPTEKNSLGTPTGLSHFWCYQATGNPVVATVNLQDQFHTQNGLQLQRPALFCNPVQKVHGTQTFPILNPQGLVCYNITRQAFKKTIAIVNQFETNNKLAVGTDRYLCVPSQTLSVTP